jgi:uncharacterized membrane protein (DUF4010 family)
MFLLYWLVGIPIMTTIFVHFERKSRDVDSLALFAMILVSLVPLLREMLVICIFIINQEFKNGGALFKRYEK